MGVTVKVGDTTRFSLDGRITGSLHGREVEFTGRPALVVLGRTFAETDAILNNRGVAACGAFGALRLGGYKRWGGGGGTLVFCDMDSLRSKLSRTAALAGASGPRAVRLPAGAPRARIQFTGQGAAPQV